LSLACFTCSTGLTKITFECNSMISRIDSDAFSDCGSLLRFLISSQLRELSNFALRGTNFPIVSGTLFYLILRGGRCNTILARTMQLPIPSSLDKMGNGCSAGNRIGRTVLLEEVCQISEIGASALTGCSSLFSICIPRSIAILGRTCLSQ
jgi:hypothetical protein